MSPPESRDDSVSDPAGSPHNPSATRANAPRPAATVLLLRGARANAPEILMVRRSAASPFMPSTYVFPGGGVDTGDGDPGRDDAFEAAARRECREEVGLSLVEELRWFDTWVTPSAERRRYHARFFLAALAPEAGHEARADDHETHDETWASAPELLDRWARNTIDLPPPTLAILLTLGDKPQEEILRLWNHDPRPPILPKWVAVSGTDHIVLPHDPAYPELPGETAPAPPRAHLFPRRFRREERRWIPVHD